MGDTERQEAACRSRVAVAGWQSPAPSVSERALAGESQEQGVSSQRGAWGSGVTWGAHRVCGGWSDGH